MALFSIKNVNFKNIVKYKDFEIKENKATFIKGKSGAGKSTLLKLLNAALTADSGKILYNNKALESYDTITLRREVMLVSQNVFLFDETIEDNFKEFYNYREQPLPSYDKIKEYLEICLALFSSSVNCRELSGGERQRVFLAISLSLNPKVLMLDEPTSALDEKTSGELMGNIKNHCKENNITLIVITHDSLLAEKYADEIISLDSEDDDE